MNFKIIPNQQTPRTPEISDVKEFIKDNEETIPVFHKYAESLDSAIGLAANQCELDGERYNLRMIAVKNAATGKAIIAIDPKIIAYKGVKKIKKEGCLTWEGKSIVAERSLCVDVEYYDVNGELRFISECKFRAQVWQHEINHINGIEEKVMDDFEEEKIKIGRNEICPCGSDKKYKKCCESLNKNW